MWAIMKASGGFCKRKKDRRDYGGNVAKKEIVCDIHPGVVLVCPKCQAAKGGLTTARRHSSKQLSEWGKRGGRPKKSK
jgi:hypothetical protein